MRHWNRGKKTVRNFLLALLLAFLVYASQGFPPYTVKGICRQFQRDYLLEEKLEPLFVRRERVKFSREKSIHFTTIAARSGDTYAIFRYEDTLLGSHRDWYMRSPALGEGAVCSAWAGIIYTAGPFEEAASAKAVIRLEKAGTAKSREFTLEGERLSDQVFAFPYEMGHHHFDDEEMDYMDMSLPELAQEWYQRPAPNADPGVHYIIMDAEVPCTVTLYGGAGEALATFPLTVTTGGLRSWY